jgi:hypothetical protein
MRKIKLTFVAAAIGFAMLLGAQAPADAAPLATMSQGVAVKTGDSLVQTVSHRRHYRHNRHHYRHHYRRHHHYYYRHHHRRCYRHWHHHHWHWRCHRHHWN